MEPEDFIRIYETALATQDWAQVESLIHRDACVTFSTSSIHKGKLAIEKAFRENFSTIKNEKYSITNVHWVNKNDMFAVYLFDFKWTGIVNKKPANGSGRGTTALIKEGKRWQLLVEHLGPDGS